MISVVNKIAKELFECGKHVQSEISIEKLFPRMFTICKEVVCWLYVLIYQSIYYDMQIDNILPYNARYCYIVRQLFIDC